MPKYSYKCDSCQKTEEIEQKITDTAITACPSCKNQTFKRVPSRDVSIQFKGSGFYINDYGQKESSDSTPKKGGCGKGSCGCH